MTANEVTAIADGIAPVVRELIERALIPILTRLAIVETKAAIPGEKGERGDRGEQGERGAPGLTLDASSFARSSFDGERTVTLRFGSDDHPIEIPIAFAIPIYRGVYDETKSYAAADVVTFGGHVWIAKRETNAKPSDLLAEGKSAWTLMAKRGRDGRDLRRGAA